LATRRAGSADAVLQSPIERERSLEIPQKFFGGIGRHRGTRRMRGTGHPIVPGVRSLALPLARKRVAPVLNPVAFHLASPALIVSVHDRHKASLHQRYISRLKSCASVNASVAPCSSPGE